MAHRIITLKRTQKPPENITPVDSQWYEHFYLILTKLLEKNKKTIVKSPLLAQKTTGIPALLAKS